MRKKSIIASGALIALISLFLNPTLFAVADNTAKQTMVSSLDGFAFTNDGCCPEVSSILNGEMIIDKDGTIELSQQNGNITIGSTTYNVEFIPNGKVSSEVVSNDCSSSTTYLQNGEINMIENNGTVIKGSGAYSWGIFPSCSDDIHSFTNFSGKMQDTGDQSIEFYTGTNSLPTTP